MKKENPKLQSGLSVPISQSFAIDRQNSEAPRKAHSYHYHNAYEMYYLTSGDRYYFIKDKTYHAECGSLVLIKPYEIHCASRYSSEPYERILISFKQGFVSELSNAIGDAAIFSCFEKDVHVVKFESAERELVEALLAVMLKEYKRENTISSRILQSSLLELLLLSAKHGSAGTEGEAPYRDTVHKTVSAVAAYINNNYAEDLSLEALAERFFISPCYLSRTFKRVTGSGFAEYLLGVRIKEAQKLLRKGQMKISAVADSVGFKSATHFGRAFKAVTGQSPVSFRKTANQSHPK